MFGALIIIVLIASIAALSAGFLMVALRMGKNFNQMGNQTSHTPQNRRRGGPQR